MLAAAEWARLKTFLKGAAAVAMLPTSLYASELVSEASSFFFFSSLNLITLGVGMGDQAVGWVGMCVFG